LEKALNKATFAGGCFWCMVDCFYLLEGVEDVIVGYAGGHRENPTYKEVKSQTTGHYEVAQVLYDDTITNYQELLAMFWRQIDPTDDQGQFQDRGASYKAAIFYHDSFQKEAAEKSKLALQDSGKFKKPIITEILPLTNFYEAEEYHQNFPTKSPKEYKEDRAISGRDEFIQGYWK